MADAHVESWWRRRLPDLSAAATRFPLAVAIAALLTLYKLYLGTAFGDAETRVMGWLVASFLWLVSVDFYAEGQGRGFHARAFLWLVGVAGLALLFWLAWDIWLNPLLLLAGLLLLAYFAGHLGRSESNASFWLFNYRLWLAGLLGLVGAGLLGAGASIIVQTLHVLFGIEIDPTVHDHIWSVALGFIAPVSVLAFAPRSLTDPITAREEADFPFRALAALVKFVLVPLVLVYTAILYAYAAKIALAWELPKGTLGNLVMGYLLVGAATLLLGYPSRETGGAHVRFFWRYWVWLAALPVVLLFIAVSRRIADYGLTEARYVVLLVGVWALILAAIRLRQGGNFDLRVVPGVLALLLLAASFGPGGAVGFSVMSQKAELESLLAGKGMLVDGKLVQRPDGSAPALGGADAARVRGIESYLSSRHALDVLAPWFEGRPDNPFAEGKTPEQATREVLAALGLAPGFTGPAFSHLNYYSDKPVSIAAGSDSFVIGPVVFQSASLDTDSPPPQSIGVDGLGSVTLRLANTLLTVALEDGGSVEFNIAQALEEIHRRGRPDNAERPPLRIEGSGSGLAGTLLIENLNGAYDEANFQLSLMRIWLVVKRAGG